jgi:ATP-dependent Clp protease ATP-binding subunit ClpC
MFERFTDRARRVVVMAQDEARLLNHDYIGTEHILLGLIREGDGVAAHVLVDAGVDLSRARQQVIELLHGHRAGVGPASAGSAPPAGDDLVSRLASVAARLEAIERRLAPSSPG